MAYQELSPPKPCLTLGQLSKPLQREAISLENLCQVCLEGPGHCLGCGQTLHLMQRHCIYPTLGDRSSPNQWEERGWPSRLERASTTLEIILATRCPSHIPLHIDNAIRSRFPVRLPRELMRPA